LRQNFGDLNNFFLCALQKRFRAVADGKRRGVVRAARAEDSVRECPECALPQRNGRVVAPREREAHSQQRNMRRRACRERSRENA